jgi:hypothetical protein
VIRLAVFLGAILTSISTYAFTPQTLWEAWPKARYEATVAPCLSHSQLMSSLQTLKSRYPDSIRLEEAGKSFLGRSIQLLSLGTGPEKILFWSQMHGDEPSATPALLDIAHYLLEHADEPVARTILQKYTLLMIPMLNPDGAEAYQRRNAQGIDINRDALRLVTPEGQLLKRIRDKFEPMLGFNLHDQDRRTAVGNTGQVANIAVLSVSGDAQNTLTPGRRRTKRANAAIVEALAPFIPGGIARYDEDWSPRAFGDNMTAWGTPIVLIESGGLPVEGGFTELTRLNFVAMLSVLEGLARDDLASYDPQVYENLPRNQTKSWSDVVVRGAYIMQPGTPRAYRADLAFDRFVGDRQVAGCAGNEDASSMIFLVGDGSSQGAGINIDARGSLLLAPFEVGVKGWSEREWLNAESLSQIARSGVGTVHWIVSEDHRQAALVFADQFSTQGLPRIEVLTNPDLFPAVVLSGPPSSPDAPASLGAILESLGVEGTDKTGMLGKMWMASAGGGLESPPLIKKRRASFLIVTPSNKGKIDFNEARLESVWLDGQQIALKPVAGN